MASSNDDEKIVEILELGISVRISQVHDLLELFDSKGWEILLKMWEQEKDEVIDSGMSLSASEEMRSMSRGAYHKLLQLATMEGNIRHAYDVAIGLVKED